MALGAGTLMLGLCILAAGAFAAHHETKAHAIKGFAAPILGVGAAVTVGGLVIIGLHPGTVQESSTTQWSPVPDNARTFGGSLGLRF
jgi:hypothetical protein